MRRVAQKNEKKRLEAERTLEKARQQQARIRLFEEAQQTPASPRMPALLRTPTSWQAQPPKLATPGQKAVSQKKAKLKMRQQRKKNETVFCWFVNEQKAIFSFTDGSNNTRIL